MNKKRKRIKYSKERAILADVLPYEIPITFSNRYFYRFLVANNISISDNKLFYQNLFQDREREAFMHILEILFGIKAINNSPTELQEWNFRKIPFSFKITHKERDFRELTIVHPINQIKLIDFYETYKELILYYCSISNFSIRKPAGIGKYTFTPSNITAQLKEEEKYGFISDGNEYENLKTFFSIEKYKNIYRFYEDYRYQRAEKKYNFLYKFDLSKCFDSIYTHSIVWAVLGLESVKEKVDESKKTFAGKFDLFIQYANYGETNGIVIGPEFSRIFAEIILQRIDKNIENKLIDKGYVLKKHYELYRYVDDYFLFCDSDLIKEEVIQLFRHELKEFKLAINNSKSKDYKKPIITEITVAKERIIKLFENEPRFQIEKKKEVDSNNNDSEEGTLLFTDYMLKFYFDSNKLATQYKIIIKETGVDYKDVLNYTLAILHNKVGKNLKMASKFLKECKELESDGKLANEGLLKKQKVEKEITDHIVNFIDFLFFLYSVSPRVNSTIKVSHILSEFILFYKKRYRNNENKLIPQHTRNNQEKVFKKILDEVTFILNKNTLNDYTQVESLYLLIVLRDLDKDFRLTEKLLAKYLNVLNKNNEIDFEECNFNYFSIVVVLFYIGNSSKYPTLKSKLMIYILSHIESIPVEKRRKSSELTHLVLDLLACPFINTTYKEQVLKTYRKNFPDYDEIQTSLDTRNIISFIKNYQKYWFTKWSNFNLEKELNAKKSLEVYS